jgi:hypothetical protein
MKTTAIPLVTLLFLAACGASAEEEVETAIREGLSERGTVLQVEIARQGEDRMTGFALLRNRAGTDVRMDCTAEREGEKSLMGESFSWRCQPT